MVTTLLFLSLYSALCHVLYLWSPPGGTLVLALKHGTYIVRHCLFNSPALLGWCVVAMPHGVTQSRTCIFLLLPRIAARWSTAFLCQWHKQNCFVTLVQILQEFFKCMLWLVSLQWNGGHQRGWPTVARLNSRIKRVQPGGMRFRISQRSVQPGGIYFWIALVIFLTNATKVDGLLLDEELDIPWCMRKSHEDEPYLFAQTLLSWALLLINSDLADRVAYPKTGRLIRLAEATQELILQMSKEKSHCKKCKVKCVKCT